MTTTKDVLQPVDQTARRLARTLVRTARYASLATIAEGGRPLASRVLVASDGGGHPLLLVSRLSGHTAALLRTPRCSLLFGEVGDGDPMAQARISLQGMAAAPEDDDRLSVRHRFLARHPGAEVYCDFGDFLFLRVAVEDASLNAGFARAYRMSGPDLVDASDAGIEARLGRAVAHMNADHADAVDAIARTHGGASGEGWRIATADRSGFELARGSRLLRVFFDRPIEAPADIRAAFVALSRPQPGAPIA